MFWYGYICYFDRFHRNVMYSSTTTKELHVSISLFMCFGIYTFGQIKMVFCRDENY